MTPVVVFKAHIRAHQMRTKTGKVVQVREHDDKRHSAMQAPAGIGHNGGPEMGAPRRSPPRHPPGHDAQRIPTRLMGEKYAQKNGHDMNSAEHTISTNEMKANPKLWEHNVGLLRHYPGTPDDMKDAHPDALAEHTINRWKDNLLWLHDKVPEETRQRSKKWYDGARAITDKWAGEYGLHPASIAGAIAALSPQKDWYMNVSGAKRVIETLQTKKDHAWDDAMSSKVAEIESMAKYPQIIERVQGKKLGELTDPHDKAFWIRAYDETHNDKSYPVLSPEGDEMGMAQNQPDKKGNVANSKMGWGSLVEIKKAVASIEANGDLSKISPLMGDEHKVRNFYNNIIAPNSPHGEITSDTHAVAAAELRPLAGSDEPVLHNFGSSMAKDKQAKFAEREGRPYVNAKSDITGVSGTYGMLADAYRRAAKERGILPREMQSITWEAVRGLFEDTWKNNTNRAKVDAIWKDASAGKLSVQEARDQIHAAAGGITPPTWHPDHPANGGAGAAGGAGRAGGDAGVDAGQRGGDDAGGVRGPELGRGEDGRGGDGRPGTAEADPSVSAGGGRGTDGDAGGEGAGDGKPHTVYKVGQHVVAHKVGRSGHAVQVSGHIRVVGRDGLTLHDPNDPQGQEHFVDWDDLGEPKVKPKGPIRRGPAKAPAKRGVRKAFEPIVAFFAKGGDEPVKVSGYVRNGHYVRQHVENRHAAQPHAAHGNDLASKFNAAAERAGSRLRLRAHEGGTFMISYTNPHTGKVESHEVSVEEAHRYYSGVVGMGSKADHHAPHRAVAERKMGHEHPYGDTTKKSDFSPPDGGDGGFAPMLVFGAAVGAAVAGASQPNASAGEADTGPGSLASQPHPEPKAEEPAAEAPAEDAAEQRRDPRLSYTKRALLAITNAWRGK